MNDLSRTEPPSEMADLTACDREPTHLPGAVEPNGAMLVLGEDALTILQASSNISRFLNLCTRRFAGNESSKPIFKGSCSPIGIRNQR